MILHGGIKDRPELLVVGVVSLAGGRLLYFMTPGNLILWLILLELQD